MATEGKAPAEQEQPLRRVVVTGGSGNVGRTVVQRLRERYDVTVFDTQPAEAGVPWTRGDILSAADLQFALRGADAVVHLAAIPHPMIDSPDRVMEVNVLGTQRVAEAAALAGARRLVMASSESTFGFVFGEGDIRPEYVPVDEAHPTQPRDPYALSKLLGEQICRQHTRRYGMATVCLRYCWVWWEREYEGVGPSPDPANFTGQLWQCVDARDVAQAVEKSLVAPGIEHETLLITADRTFIDRPTLELLEEFYPGTRVTDEGYFAAEPRRSPYNCRRAKEVLGFAPEHDALTIARAEG